MAGSVSNLTEPTTTGAGVVQDPPGAPSCPSFPGAPAVPSLPGAPSLPSLPGAPVPPGAPGKPGLPSAPSFPAAPAGPAVFHESGDSVLLHVSPGDRMRNAPFLLLSSTPFLSTQPLIQSPRTARAETVRQMMNRTRTRAVMRPPSPVGLAWTAMIKSPAAAKVQGKKRPGRSRR